jgi:hypothetical protein
MDKYFHVFGIHVYIWNQFLSWKNRTKIDVDVKFGPWQNKCDRLIDIETSILL